MSKVEYVPAIGEQFNSVWKRGLDYKGFDMKFFTDKSHFNYNIGLQSCYYGMEGVGKGCDLQDNNYRKLIGYPKDKVLIGDSGGFQIASFKKKGLVCNLTPLKSLRWQEANCDIGMNLDVPPTLDKVPSFSEFNDALKVSVDNFKLFESKRENYKLKLYNVLHGETIKHMDIWYNAVKDFNFDGWAVGMKPPWDSMIQAMGFMYLWEKGEFDKSSFTGVHFFGTSGKHVCPTLAYCASKLKKQKVTYDSSSYNIGSIYRTYYLPYDIGPSLSFGEKFKVQNPNITSLPCRCPVCNSIDDINDLNGKDIYAGTLISLHNMWQYVQFNDTLNGLVNQKDKFVDYLNKINIDKKTLVSFDFIDFAMEHGLDKAVKKFNNWLISQTIDKTKQRGIWDY